MENVILNDIFTRPCFMALLNKKKGSYIDKYLNLVSNYYDGGDKKNIDVIKDLYLYMEKNYRNEYFFKNTLKNELLVKRHSKELYDVKGLSELPVGSSIADYLIINGEGNIYEIKSDLDTLYRLEGQIIDYYKAFKHVNVVLSEANYKDFLNVIDNKYLGVYILRDSGQLDVIKESKENKECLDISTMFSILRKYEYENIIKREYGYLPESSDYIFPIKCFEMAKSIEKEDFYYLMIRELKNRINKKNIDNFRKVIPYELNYIMYYLLNDTAQYDKLQVFLNSTWRDQYVFSNY